MPAVFSPLIGRRSILDILASFSIFPVGMDDPRAVKADTITIQDNFNTPGITLHFTSSQHDIISDLSRPPPRGVRCHDVDVGSGKYHMQ